MNKPLAQELQEVLHSDQRFLTADGSVLSNLVREKANQHDSGLLNLLIANEALRQHFFIEQEKYLVFDNPKFQLFVSSGDWLPGSFTAHSNRIGLMDANGFLVESSDVVLSWPYKDCVLVGGMREGEKSRTERFYNEVLAPDQITKLFEPKALRSGKRVSKEGDNPIESFEINEDGIYQDNFILRGNNLFALASILPVFKSSFKLIYIDPPYNTEQDLLYNDKFKNSTWLTFMKNRLELARKLMHEDGLIAVQIDNRMYAHLKMLLDEIFGVENFRSMISVKVKESGGVGNDDFLIDVMEHIFVYSKSEEVEFDVPRKETLYIPENESNYTSVLDIEDTGELVRVIEGGAVGEIKVYKHNAWGIRTIAKGDRTEKTYVQNFEKIARTTNPQGGLMKRILPSFPKSKDELFTIEYVPVRGKNKGKVVREQIFNQGLVLWLKTTAKLEGDKITKYERPTNAWVEENLYQGIANEGGVTFPNGKKPEKLIERILKLHLKEGDKVLDFFLGSGTTAAVAHKLGIQYVGIEQLNYGENDFTRRLQNVIAGDSTGISKEVGWKGGGTFVYMELAERNANLIERIMAAENAMELSTLAPEISNSVYLSHLSDLPQKPWTSDEIEALGIQETKALLMNALDKNALYVNLSELDEDDTGLQAEDIKLTNMFYSKGK